MFDFSAGENAIFQCKLKDSTEAVKVTWLRDNKPLTDRLMDRCSISGTESDHKLELMHCREDDTGVYTAVAENVKGNAHCTAQLVVYECKFFYFTILELRKLVLLYRNFRLGPMLCSIHSSTSISNYMCVVNLLSL